MDELLTPISTTYRPGSRKEEPLLQEVKTAATAPPQPSRQQFTAASADESLEILRNEPNHDTLVCVLRYLLSDKASVDVRQPGPVSAQIVQILVTSILPNYWAVLHEDQEDGSTKSRKKGSKGADLNLLLKCLRSITGLSALLVRIRALLAEAKASSAKEPSSDAFWQLKMLLEVISDLLREESSVSQIWNVSVVGTVEAPKRRPLAQEFVRLLGSGRIVSLAAEAETVLKEQPVPEKITSTWIANGREYCSWLVRAIVQWSLRSSKDEEQEELKLRGDLLAKALHLGYQDEAIAALVTDLLLVDISGSDAVYASLVNQLPAHEQKKIVFSVSKYVTEKHLGSVSGDSPTTDADLISAAAGLLEKAVGTSQAQLGHLVSVLLTDPTFGVNNGVGIRRAALAVISKDRTMISDTLEKSMEQFSDQLYIKHSPTIQQEARTQVLLLAAGYVHRENPRTLGSMLRSRAYLDAVSNRLSASQNRARFLGMAVGEALSGLVDDKSRKLDFHMEEMESEEAIWYKGLVHVSDTVGSIESLRRRTKKSEGDVTHQRSAQPNKPAPKVVNRPPPRVPQTTGFVIEEVGEDEEDEEDDDLVPYAKPDSDDEDSDDDPTVIRRDKPKAPVYIRDLITYFRDTESYDRQRLALTTAPLLIRRKANFGMEVQQHATDLASILASLQDTYDMDDFYQLKLQGMVALVVAQPKSIGPQFSLAFFAGDYSMSQRAAILTALGLGAREMAGFEISEYTSAAAFPSKQLPDRVERLYLAQAESGPGLPASTGLKALPAGALDSVAQSLTASFLGPIAAKAADEATGPDVLKLASFKSRLQKDSNGQPVKKNKAAARPAKANTMSPIIATSIFFPLTARFQMALQSSSAARLRRFLFDPSLLSLYLKTLAVVLHATGPSAMALPDMTTELWDLLLGSSVQAHCVGDVMVTHAVLFALLALLDVNENRMRDLCRNNARQVVQTRDWALQVLQSTRGEDNGGSGSQESEIQMLAAGTYLRLSEGMENYRSFLLGEMVG